MPYVHHVEIDVAPDRSELWAPRARNHLSIMARQPGLMSMRLYRDVKQRRCRFSIAVWRAKDDALRALASTEVKLAALADDGALAAPSRVIVRELELIDHVFGRKGPRAFLPLPGGFANHLFTHVPTERRVAWDPYRRNFGSVVARQNGVTSYELMQDLADPEIVLVLRNYESESYASIMKGASPTYQPNREIDYATRPARDLDLYRDAKPVVYTDCELLDGVVGANGIALYEEFMQNLEPV